MVWYASEAVKQCLSNQTIRNSGLGNNQADASLAVRAFGSIVLTNERKGKAGPLRMAAEQGGQVVSLCYEVEPSGLSLGAYLANLKTNYT